MSLFDPEELRETMQPGSNPARPLEAGEIAFGLGLADRVASKYAPAFSTDDAARRAALALYFLPHRSRKSELGVTRPRVLKWYAPFADQAVFPSGHRYSLNVYTGCSHGCIYCYANAYVDGRIPSRKERFRTDLLKDLADLDRFDVPSAPLHLSNSTDAFQPLERQTGDTLFALHQALRSRKHFTSITLLTKNPAVAARPEYVDVLRALQEIPVDHPEAAMLAALPRPSLCIEVSVAFADENVRKTFDPGAPAIDERLDAIRTLRHAGIPVILRIDPLFPRDPLPGGVNYADFGLPCPQTPDALERLVRFAAETGIERIVYSVARLTRPRIGELVEPMQRLRNLYDALSRHVDGVPARWRCGSWRLSESYVREEVVEPFRELCRRCGMTSRHCMENLMETR